MLGCCSRAQQSSESHESQATVGIDRIITLRLAPPLAWQARDAVLGLQPCSYARQLVREVSGPSFARIVRETGPGWLTCECKLARPEATLEKKVSAFSTFGGCSGCHYPHTRQKVKSEHSSTKWKVTLSQVSTMLIIVDPSSYALNAIERLSPWAIK